MSPPPIRTALGLWLVLALACTSGPTPNTAIRGPSASFPSSTSVAPSGATSSSGSAVPPPLSIAGVAGDNPPQPPHALAFAGFTGDALVLVTEKGDQLRFDLKGGGMKSNLRPKSGKISESDPSDDLPEVRAVSVDSEMHPIVFKESGKVEVTAKGNTINLAMRPTPKIWPGMACNDCRFSEFSVSSDGTFAATAFGISNDQVLRLYNLAKAAELAPPKNAGHKAVFDHSSKRAAMMGFGGPIVVQDMVKGIQVFSVERGDLGQYNLSLVWSKDDTLLSAASDGMMMLIDVAAKKARCSGAFLGPFVFSHAHDWFTAFDDKTPVVVATKDCSVLRKASPIAEYPVGATLGMNDTRLAVVYRDKVIVLDTSTGDVAVTLRVGPTSAIAFTRGGKAESFGDGPSAWKLISCSAGGTILDHSVCKERASSPGLLAYTLGVK